MEQQPGKPQIPSLKDMGKQKDKEKDTKSPLIPSFKDTGKPQLKIKGLAGSTMSLLERVKQFKKKDLAFIMAGLGVLFMAPLAEHFMMSPENGDGGNNFKPGFGVKDGVSWGSGNTPYDNAGGGLSPGSPTGAGADIITPLNVRDPSALVMGPGASQPQPVTAPAPKPEAPSKTASSDWKDALANAASQGGHAAVKAASPVPKIPLQGGLRGLGAVSGGSGASSQLGPINANNVPNRAADSHSLSHAIAPTGFKGVGQRGPGSGEAGNLDKLKSAANNAANLMNKGTGGSAIDNTAAASAAIPTGGAGTEGSGAGGSDQAGKGGSQNGSTGGKSQGESLAFQLAKSRAEKEMDLEFKKKEAGDMELEMFKLRNKALETFADGMSKAASDWVACLTFKQGSPDCYSAAEKAGYLSCIVAGSTPPKTALVPVGSVGKCGASAGSQGGAVATLCKCISNPTSLCGSDGTTEKFSGCSGAPIPDGAAGGGPDCSKDPDKSDPTKCNTKGEPVVAPAPVGAPRAAEVVKTDPPITQTDPINTDSLAQWCASFSSGKASKEIGKMENGKETATSKGFKNYQQSVWSAMQASQALTGNKSVDCPPPATPKLKPIAIESLGKNKTVNEALKNSETQLRDGSAGGLSFLVKAAQDVLQPLKDANAAQANTQKSMDVKFAEMTKQAGVIGDANTKIDAAVTALVGQQQLSPEAQAQIEKDIVAIDNVAAGKDAKDQIKALVKDIGKTINSTVKGADSQLETILSNGLAKAQAKEAWDQARKDALALVMDDKKQPGVPGLDPLLAPFVKGPLVDDMSKAQAALGGVTGSKDVPDTSVHGILNVAGGYNGRSQVPWEPQKQSVLSQVESHVASAKNAKDAGDSHFADSKDPGVVKLKADLDQVLGDINKANEDMRKRYATQASSLYGAKDLPKVWADGGQVYTVNGVEPTNYANRYDATRSLVESGQKTIGSPDKGVVSYINYGKLANEQLTNAGNYVNDFKPADSKTVDEKGLRYLGDDQHGLKFVQKTVDGNGQLLNQDLSNLYTQRVSAVLTDNQKALTSFAPATAPAPAR